MKKSIKFLFVAVFGLSLIACSSPAKMAELANNVKVTCDPSVLEVKAGNVDAVVTVNYPKGYFHPKAILEVTPVLVYQGGESKMAPFMYQGTKVKDNYKVVSSNGQTVTEKVHFPYVKGMEKAVLELRGVVKYKKKSVSLPVKKVAVGCKTTYMLVNKDGYMSLRKDNYQDIINQTAEGQIMYTINSADVANKQLKGQSIQDFKEALKEIDANTRKTLKSTEVIAYASPDGGVKLNDKLSEKRAGTADKAWNKVTKGETVTDPEIKSMGQDWEGFQELVKKSNIEDKDLILRVLSMYSDPAVREREIRNMSQIFTALKKNILPELRRARFIANVEYQNYTSAELLKLIEENSDILDEEALLRAATLVKNNTDKETLYNKAISKFGSDRAQYNLAVVLLNSGNVDAAAKALANVKEQDADYDNVLGVIALRKGDLATATKLFKKANNADAKKNLGVVYILEGNYDAAAKAFANDKSSNAGLALLLIGQPKKALEVVACNCPRANYIKAVAAARIGDSKKVAEFLSNASTDPALKDRVANDIEFSKYNVVIK